MRTNLPVSHNEYQFPDTETLLSTTDTDSRISYAHAAFVRASGFEMDELLGQPHSLEEGQSWRALVKNRRKNGDHYWVCANAAPMRRNGQLTGYLSVRTKLSRAAGLAFHRLMIVRTGPMRWTSALQLLPAAWRVWEGLPFSRRESPWCWVCSWRTGSSRRRSARHQPGRVEPAVAGDRCA